MKTSLPTFQNRSRPFANPLRRPALPLFFALAFLPSILRLAAINAPMTNPFVALGPVVASFWLAVSLREVRLNFSVIGLVTTVLFWSVNWLMLAGGVCCKSID